MSAYLVGPSPISRRSACSPRVGHCQAPGRRRRALWGVAPESAKEHSAAHPVTPPTEHRERYPLQATVAPTRTRTWSNSNPNARATHITPHPPAIPPAPPTADRHKLQHADVSTSCCRVGCRHARQCYPATLNRGSWGRAPALSATVTAAMPPGKVRPPALLPPSPSHVRMLVLQRFRQV